MVEWAGIKVFALVGKVANAGLVEVPMGTTINEIVYDIGGGTGNDNCFNALTFDFFTVHN